MGVEGCATCGGGNGFPPLPSVLPSTKGGASAMGCDWAHSKRGEGGIEERERERGTIDPRTNGMKQGRTSAPSVSFRFVLSSLG